MIWGTLFIPKAAQARGYSYEPALLWGDELTSLWRGGAR